MPTGYTYPVAEGKVTSFREFAVECSRAFGANVIFRDSPHANVTVPIDVSDYHPKSLKKAREELARWDKLSENDQRTLWRKEHDESVRMKQDAIDKHTVENKRMMNMLAEVYAWQPPTPEHVKFKEFMVQQLTDSIDKDMSYYAPKEIQPFEEWRFDHEAYLQREVKYHSEQLVNEQERTDSRNKWVEDFVRSLPK